MGSWVILWDSWTPLIGPWNNGMGKIGSYDDENHQNMFLQQILTLFGLGWITIMAHMIAIQAHSLTCVCSTMGNIMGWLDTIHWQVNNFVGRKNGYGGNNCQKHFFQRFFAVIGHGWVATMAHRVIIWGHKYNKFHGWILRTTRHCPLADKTIWWVKLEGVEAKIVKNMFFNVFWSFWW